MLATISRFGTDNLVVTDVRGNEHSTFAVSQTLMSLAIIAAFLPVLWSWFGPAAFDISLLACAFAASASISNYSIGQGKVLPGILMRGVGPYFLLLLALLVQRYEKIGIGFIAILYLSVISPYMYRSFRHQIFSTAHHMREIRLNLVRPSLILISASNSIFTNILIVLSSENIVSLSVTEANLVQRIGNGATSLANVVFWTTPTLIRENFWKYSASSIFFIWVIYIWSSPYLEGYSDISFAIVSISFFQISVGLSRVYDYEKRYYKFLAIDHFAALIIVSAMLFVSSVPSSYFGAAVLLLALRAWR